MYILIACFQLYILTFFSFKKSKPAKRYKRKTASHILAFCYYNFVHTSNLLNAIKNICQELEKICQNM